MDQYFAVNQDLWNNLAEINHKSQFYDLAGFRAGNLSLNAPELAALGDVRGKSLLHLQCHFGLDTLSWARLGANVTGVDFSHRAITLANGIASELQIPARFIETNIYQLPEHLDEQFDIIFTSYGVIGWLPDLTKWGELIARYLKPGGIFYIIEFHPFLFMLDEEQAKDFRYSYFESSTLAPLELESHAAYADRDAELKHRSYEWVHSFSEIINGLVKAGLKIESMDEFPYSVYNCWPFLSEFEPGTYRIKDMPVPFPLMFAIKATR